MDAPGQPPSIHEVLRSNHCRDGIASLQPRPFVADPKMHRHVTVGPKDGSGILAQECPIESRHRMDGLRPGQSDADFPHTTCGLEIHAVVAVGERHDLAGGGAYGGQPVMGDLGNLARDGTPGFREPIFKGQVPPDRQEAWRYRPRAGLFIAFETRRRPGFVPESQQALAGGTWKDRTAG